MTLSVAIQMDPVEGINIETDTTFLLMLEAQTRGHGLWVYTPDKLSLEDGRVLGPGEAGEIYVRGEQVSGEYKEKSALTADGWFPTRDAGYMDEDGYIFLSGRADDVIVRGGENMSPGEIEDVLLTHPAVADACACAVPSVEWGEAVGIAVVVREGHPEPAAEELKDLIRARLRSSRVPDTVAFVAELPYNEMGKLLRREVKKILAG